MDKRAHRARQEHTRRCRDLAIASYAAQTRIQQLGHRHASLVRRPPARFKGVPSALAMRATRGLMDRRAQRAKQEVTRRRQEKASARAVQQTPTRLRGAQLWRAAYAAQDTRLLERRAHCARQEHSRRCRDQANAANAAQTRIQQAGHRHASLVRQTPALLKGAHSAVAMRATRGLMVMDNRAQLARQEVTRF